MRPVLFELFGVEVASYAAFMAVGYIAALWVVMRQTRRAPPPRALDRDQVWDLFIVMLVSSLVGAKLGHVLFEAPGHALPGGRVAAGIGELLEADPWHWARLGESGYVWYGGLIGALATAVVYFARRPALDAWLYADAFAPAIALGAFFGRLGCLLAGCCHGRPTDVPWALALPGHAAPLHPTQLYDAAAGLALFAWAFARFPRRRFPGEQMGGFLVGYAALRALSEVFRGDLERGAFGGVSTSQLLSIPLAALGVWILRTGRARAARAAAAPEPGAPRADDATT